MAVQNAIQLLNSNSSLYWQATILLVYGRELRIPLDVHGDTPLLDCQPQTVVQYAETVKQEHRRLKEEVKMKLADAQARQAQAFDKGVREAYYVAGDLVYLYSPGSEEGTFPKIALPVH